MSVRQRAIALAVVAITIGAGTAGRAAGTPIASAARTADRAVRVVMPHAVSPDVDVRAAQALVDAVNAARAGRGLPPLRWDDSASMAAHAHAVDMAASNEMRHLGSDGSDAGARLRTAGVVWSTWGEAIGAGSRDAPSLVQAWMASPSHRSVLLGAFTRVGAGVAMAADGTPYWTLDVIS